MLHFIFCFFIGNYINVKRKCFDSKMYGESWCEYILLLYDTLLNFIDKKYFLIRKMFDKFILGIWNSTNCESSFFKYIYFPLLFHIGD